MPKPTFHHLSQERQQEILDVALQEFSARSLHEASVGNITKELGLSRASFYKYFENMEELYSYLYHQIASDSHSLLLDALKESKGDLFKGMQIYLKSMTKELFDSRYHGFYRSMFLKIDYGTLTKLESPHQMDTKAEGPSPNFLEELAKTIHYEELNLKKEEIRPFFEFLTEITHEIFKKAFFYDWSPEEAEEAFAIRLKWIEKGIRKEDE